MSVSQTEPLRVVAIDHTGSYMQIGKAFDPLFGWCATRNLLGPRSRMLGVFYDDPFSVAEDELRSRACVVVDGPVDVAPPVMQPEVA